MGPGEHTLCWGTRVALFPRIERSQRITRSHDNVAPLPSQLYIHIVSNMNTKKITIGQEVASTKNRDRGTKIETRGGGLK